MQTPPLACFTDEISGLRFELHCPRRRPDCWQAYLDGAEERYRHYGVLNALKREQFSDGRTTASFFVAFDERNRIVAGVRCHEPLHAAADAYALEELAAHPRLPALLDLLRERIAEGVVETKGAWVSPNLARPGVSAAMSRCVVHAMHWHGARYALGTASGHVIPLWEAAGGRRPPGFDAVPYPDARYQTEMVWWDRTLLPQHTEPGQWTRILQERRQLDAEHRSRQCLAPATQGPTWQPEILDERMTAHAARLAELRALPGIEVLDRLDEQRAALHRLCLPPPPDAETDGPRWVYYPWRHALVQLLGPHAFRRLRLDRNRNKITDAEQDRLAGLRVGVVGLSVGHSIAHTLALEGVCGLLRLADFDSIELSNLNRIPATVLDLGLNKSVVLARRIAELDPYLPVEILPRGLDAGRLEAFVSGLDLVVEECDSLDVKVMLREAARRARIPVLMETSDRGLFDVERYDLEPERPLFHGLLGGLAAGDLVGLATRDKVPHILRILEPAEISSRLAASMTEIDETVTTWPQLAGDVMLGAATITTAVRRLGRDGRLPSGRVRADLDATLDRLATPAGPVAAAAPAPAPARPQVPREAGLAVAHAANLAPSGGNVQPWRLQLDARQLRIFLDRTRTSLMDVRFRGSWVAIGAALLNARIAAAAHGMPGRARCFPDPGTPDLVAELVFGQGADTDLASLYSLTLERSTNRLAGRPAAIADDTVAGLRAAVAAEGAQLRLITAADSLAEYAELLGESDRLRFLSPRLHAEMMRELRWPGENLETGIDVHSLELDATDLAKLAIGRRADVMAELAAWDGGRALGTLTRERIRSSSALALVTVPDAQPASYVRGGSALQRLWLAAHAAGLAVQPVSPLSVFAVDDEDFHSLVPAAQVARLQALAARLRRLGGMQPGEQLALVLRLSHVAAPPSVRSLRLPLEQALLGTATAPVARSASG